MKLFLAPLNSDSMSHPDQDYICIVLGFKQLSTFVLNIWQQNGARCRIHWMHWSDTNCNYALQSDIVIVIPDDVTSFVLPPFVIIFMWLWMCLTVHCTVYMHYQGLFVWPICWTVIHHYFYLNVLSIGGKLDFVSSNILFSWLRSNRFFDVIFM